MNAELVSSETYSEAPGRGTSLAEASHALLGGWWNAPLGRLAVGESTRTPHVAAGAFGPVPESVRRARRFAADAVEGWGLARMAEDVRLIVSELVGNACRHAVPDGPSGIGRVVLQLRCLERGRRVVCMVADPSERGPVRVEAHHFAECGRGLGLVSAFSSEWGWERIRGRGKIVWALCDAEG